MKPLWRAAMALAMLVVDFSAAASTNQQKSEIKALELAEHVVREALRKICHQFGTDYLHDLISHFGISSSQKVLHRRGTDEYVFIVVSLSAFNEPRKSWSLEVRARKYEVGYLLHPGQRDWLFPSTYILHVELSGEGDFGMADGSVTTYRGRNHAGLISRYQKKLGKAIRELMEESIKNLSSKMESNEPRPQGIFANDSIFVEKYFPSNMVRIKDLPEEVARILARRNDRCVDMLEKEWKIIPGSKRVH